MENTARSNTRVSHYWTDDETLFMLNLLKDMNIIKYMDGRKTRNGELFKKVVTKMTEGGFPRSVEQIRVRWKHIRKLYFQAKRDNGASGRGRSTCQFFDVLDELLGSRPLSRVEDNGVDSGVQLQTTMDATMDAEETSLLEGLPGSSSSRETSTISSPPRSSTPLRTNTTDLPGTRTQQQSRRLRETDLLQEMRLMAQAWKEDVARSEAREERLIGSILQSTDAMMERMMQRCEAFQSRPNAPQQPQHHQTLHHQPQPPQDLYGYPSTSHYHQLD